MFNIGDRVVCTKVYDALTELVGVEGTVICSNAFELGVEWDMWSSSMHNLDGQCKNGHGWYIGRDYIEHANFSLENE